MGEIAEMMMEGAICEGCGAYLADAGEGFPQLCAGCAKDRRAAGCEIIETGFGTFQDVTLVTAIGPKPSNKKMNCPECGKRIKKAGINDHIRAVHNNN